MSHLFMPLEERFAQRLDTFLAQAVEEAIYIPQQDEDVKRFLLGLGYIEELSMMGDVLATPKGREFFLLGGFVQLYQQQIESQQLRQREMQSIEAQAKYARRAFWTAVVAIVISAVTAAAEVYSALK